MTNADEQDGGASAIVRERARQQKEEGFTRAYDARHRPQELIDAALAYTVQAQDLLTAAAGEGVGGDGPDTYWPWDMTLFKKNDDVFRSLAKAGALLAAAYDLAFATGVAHGGRGPVAGAIARRPDGGNVALREEEEDGTRYWQYAYDEGGDNADHWKIVFNPASQADLS